MDTDLKILNKYNAKYATYVRKYSQNGNLNTQLNEHSDTQLKGGAYPMYIQYSRLSINSMNDIVEQKKIKEIIDAAVESKRYSYKYLDLYGNKITHGIDPGAGDPKIDALDTTLAAQKNVKKLNIDSFESLLIINELYTLNALLKKYNIATIQSQPSYYVNECSFAPPYLNLPYVEFVGSRDAIPIFKMIVDHDLMKHYFASSFSEIDTETKRAQIRLTIMRPYFDKDNRLVSGFDDKEFWGNVVNVVKDISDRNIPLVEFNTNDPDLDEDKDWYMINPNGEAEKIQDKHAMNKYVDDMPLSTLNVRYGPNYMLFMYKLTLPTEQNALSIRFS